MDGLRVRKSSDKIAATPPLTGANCSFVVETRHVRLIPIVTIDPRLHRIVAAQPYPLLFATISGAHLYGFPSPDSDVDLRGVHVLPLEKVVGLDVHNETIEDSRAIEGLEMDIVSHDVRKYFGLLLKKNGYVLEQLFSPLIVHTTPEHAELKEICRARLSPRSSRGHEAHSSGKGEGQSLLTSAATGVARLTSHGPCP